MEQPQQFTVKRKPISGQSFTSSQTYTLVVQRDESDTLPDVQQDWIQTTQGWKPFWTRRLVLAGLAVWHAMLLIALAFIGAFSRKHDGIASVHVNQYYLWTYGPTAVLVGTLAVWNRVDYRIRQMAPWQALSSSTFMPASKTILLDYLSPTLPEVLLHSLKNQHWSVLISSIVGLLQTILIVLSTSFFTVSSMPTTTTEVSYTTTTKFTKDGSWVLEMVGNYLPGDIYNAIKNSDLPYPVGTTEQFAYQVFSPTNPGPSAQVIQKAKVDVATVDLDCEVGSLSLDQWEFSWLYPSSCVQLDKDDRPPDLHGSGSILSNDCNITYHPAVPYGQDQSISSFAFADTVQCNSFGTFRADYSNSNVRVVLGIGQAQQSGTVGPYPTKAECNKTSTPATLDVLRSSVWVCTLKPEVRPATVTFNSTLLQMGTSPDVQVDPEALPSALNNISIWDFGNLYATMSSWEDNKTLPINLTAIATPHSIVDQILSRDIHATTEDYMTTDLYLNLSKDYFTEYGVQMLHWGLTQPDDSLVNGTMEANGDRLLIRKSTTVDAQFILGVIVVLICVIMIDLPGRSIVPHDLADLRGVSNLLATNSALLSPLKGRGTASIAQLRQECSQWRFRASLCETSTQPHTKTLVVEKNFNAEHLVKSSYASPGSARITWWHPLAARKSGKTLVFVLVILMIVALQVLLVVSHRYQGIANVSIRNDDRLGWSLVPAAIMAGVAMYFRALQGIYRTFAPYSKLRRSAGARATMDANYMSSTDLEVLVLSLRDRQIGLCFMAMSTLISSFLTIFVSGVFDLAMVPSHTPSAVHRTSWFTSNGSNDDGVLGNNAVLSGLIIESNLSYPHWTYEDLVFGSLRLEDDMQGDSNQESDMIQVTSSAIRPSLNCTLYDQEDFQDLFYFTGFGSSHGHYGVYSKIPGSVECAGNGTSLISQAGPNKGRPPFVWSGFQNSTLGGNRDNSQGNCPQLNYFWGYQAPIPDDASNSSVTYAKALICYETIEQVEVNATFYLPSFSTSSEHPPTPDESTVKPFSAAEVSIPYGHMPRLANESSSPNFFGALSYKYGITENDLRKLDRANDVAEAIKNAHRIIRAQQYSAALRYNETANDTAGSGSPPVYQGTLIHTQRYRLVQNTTSTHILSALLLSMLICALLASFFSSTKHILPKNPCSIAAMVSLLADSNILPQNNHRDSKGSLVSMLQGGYSDSHLTDARFKMGRFKRASDGEQVFTINCVDDSSSSKRYNSVELRDVPERVWSTGKPDGFVQVSQTET